MVTNRVLCRRLTFVSGAVRWCVIALTIATLPSVSFGQAGTQRGATLGGLAGAVAGGLIGDHNGEAGAGAAIGGVVGALAGGVLGNANDKENAYRRQQQYYQSQQQAMVVTQSAVSIHDVISMSRSGLSEMVIVNQINQRGVQQSLTVADIIALHQQGVSESVISAMQQAPTGMQRAARSVEPVPQQVIRTAPVIVQEHIVVPSYGPRYYYPPPYRSPRHRSGFHVRF